MAFFFIFMSALHLVKKSFRSTCKMGFHAKIKDNKINKYILGTSKVLVWTQFPPFHGVFLPCSCIVIRCA
uniref:Uncharacterized protein n=1 Tax=Anguilla anguilla TaxID=7936 RepID=A0A0E9QIC6_ANGAN